jgi:hypothetical protein
MRTRIGYEIVPPFYPLTLSNNANANVSARKNERAVYYYYLDNVQCLCAD